MAIENADVEGHTVRQFDISEFLRANFAMRENSYNEKVALIVQNIDSGEEAVDLLKSLGSGVSCPETCGDFVNRLTLSTATIGPTSV